MPTKKQTFLQGTLILVAAGLLTKLLGFINRIFLSRIIGAEGMGLYQMAVPTLYLVITLTQFGLPIAISKLVAEATAQNDHKKVKAILKISLFLVTILSVIFTTAMILGAPMISRYLLTDTRAYYSLIGIAPIVPIVAISSVIRGYFQGKQNMTPTASSQIIEQVIRIFTVLLLASYFLPMGVEYAAAAAMVGVVIGEFAGMIALVMHFRGTKMRQIWAGSRLNQAIKRHAETWKGLLRIALPVTSGRLIGSLTFWIEPIIVAQSLAIAGLATAAATTYYGQLQGMAIPLLTFPTFFTYSLAVSLVPAVAEAHAQKNWAMVHRRIHQSLRLALVIGAPFTVILYIFAEPLSEVIYGSAEVGSIMKLMVPFCLFLYFQGPLAATLQGLDYAQVAMKNSIYGAILKTFAIYILATNPNIGTNGITIAISIGIVIVTLLHFFSVVKLTGLSIQLRDFIKVALSMIGMGWFGILSFEKLQVWMPQSAALFSASLGAIFIYLIFLLFLKVLGKQDIQRIPFLGKFISPLFPLR
ncbi:stage V sporulation protein B [Ammoniphilus sp. CFH 90114]|uniref:stage V sporulation protein B n=1 Tax=Ammoniphilus sp. CFH 90114 TaxID=2493665 RepID=UPI00100DF922|nr:stage V sporulation protein B [Ammoniphilus sp. CFH 90114]RXT14751.1 stage V sporulation protein B [Ammoniphilus sp. CFH 90114]